jgi:hypothetical protein
MKHSSLFYLLDLSLAAVLNSRKEPEEQEHEHDNESD